MFRVRFSGTPDTLVFAVSDIASLLRARDHAFSIEGNKNKLLTMFIECPPQLQERWDDVYGPEISATDDLLMYRYLGLIYALGERQLALAELVRDSQTLGVANAFVVDFHTLGVDEPTQNGDNVITVDFNKRAIAR